MRHDRYGRRNSFLVEECSGHQGLVDDRPAREKEHLTTFADNFGPAEGEATRQTRHLRVAALAYTQIGRPRQIQASLDNAECLGWICRNQHCHPRLRARNSQILKSVVRCARVAIGEAAAYTYDPDRQEVQ